MLRYYYYFNTWSVVQTTLFLQNISLGDGNNVQQHYDIMRESCTGRFSSPSWLSHINDSRVAPLQKSLSLLAQYEIAFFGNDLLAILNVAANTPFNPTSAMPRSLQTPEYQSRISDFIQGLDTGKINQGDSLFMTYNLSDPGQVNWFYGLYYSLTNNFTREFVNAANKLFAAPLDKLILREERVDSSIFAPLYLTGAGVEQFQALPFLWVDATPIGDGIDSFYANITPVDGAKKHIWSKMYKAGWLTDSDMRRLVSEKYEEARTRFLVERALVGIAEQIKGQPGSNVTASQLFYSTQFLVPLSNQTMSHDVQLQAIQFILRRQPLSQQAINPIVDLVRLHDLLRRFVDLTFARPKMLAPSLLQPLAVHAALFDMFGFAIARLLSVGVSLGLDNGQSITARDITQSYRFDRVLNLITSSNGSSCSVSPSWPSVLQTPEVQQSFAAKDYPKLLDILFCGRKWRALPSANFNYQNH